MSYNYRLHWPFGWHTLKLDTSRLNNTTIMPFECREMVEVLRVRVILTKKLKWTKYNNNTKAEKRYTRIQVQHSFAVSFFLNHKFRMNCVQMTFLRWTLIENTSTRNEPAFLSKNNWNVFFFLIYCVNESVIGANCEFGHV